MVTIASTHLRDCVTRNLYTCILYNDSITETICVVGELLMAVLRYVVMFCMHLLMTHEVNDVKIQIFVFVIFLHTSP